MDLSKYFNIALEANKKIRDITPEFEIEAENKAKEIFDSIPSLCEVSANNGDFDTCIFKIEDKSASSFEYEIMNRLIIMLEDNEIPYADFYETESKCHCCYIYFC